MVYASLTGRNATHGNHREKCLEVDDGDFLLRGQWLRHADAIVRLHHRVP